MDVCFLKKKLKGKREVNVLGPEERMIKYSFVHMAGRIASPFFFSSKEKTSFSSILTNATNSWCSWTVLTAGFVSSTCKPCCRRGIKPVWHEINNTNRMRERKKKNDSRNSGESPKCHTIAHQEMDILLLNHFVFFLCYTYFLSNFTFSFSIHSISLFFSFSPSFLISPALWSLSAHLNGVLGDRKVGVIRGENNGSVPGLHLRDSTLV